MHGDARRGDGQREQDVTGLVGPTGVDVGGRRRTLQPTGDGEVADLVLVVDGQERHATGHRGTRTGDLLVAGQVGDDELVEREQVVPDRAATELLGVHVDVELAGVGEDLVDQVLVDVEQAAVGLVVTGSRNAQGDHHVAVLAGRRAMHVRAGDRVDQQGVVGPAQATTVGRTGQPADAVAGASAVGDLVVALEDADDGRRADERGEHHGPDHVTGGLVDTGSTTDVPGAEERQEHRALERGQGVLGDRRHVRPVGQQHGRPQRGGAEALCPCVVVEPVDQHDVAVLDSQAVHVAHQRRSGAVAAGPGHPFPGDAEVVEAIGHRRGHGGLTTDDHDVADAVGGQEGADTCRQPVGPGHQDRDAHVGPGRRRAQGVGEAGRRVVLGAERAGDDRAGLRCVRRRLGEPATGDEEPVGKVDRGFDAGVTGDAGDREAGRLELADHVLADGRGAAHDHDLLGGQALQLGQDPVVEGVGRGHQERPAGGTGGQQVGEVVVTAQQHRLLRTVQQRRPGDRCGDVAVVGGGHRGELRGRGDLGFGRLRALLVHGEEAALTGVGGAVEPAEVADLARLLRRVGERVSGVEQVVERSVGRGHGVGRRAVVGPLDRGAELDDRVVGLVGELDDADLGGLRGRGPRQYRQDE